MLIERLLAVKPSDNNFVYLIKTTIERFDRHDISQTGGQLAYFFLLALSPFLIFFNALIGSLNLKSDVILAELSPFLPKQITELIASYNDYILTNQNISLLSIGLIVTLFSASRAVRSLIYAINHAYEITKERSLFYQLIISVLFTICVGIIMLLLILLITASSDFLNYITKLYEIPDHFVLIIQCISWIVAALILFVILSAIYYIIPNKKLRFRNIIPGIVFSFLSSIVFTLAFSLYINNFSNYSVMYGSTGAVIILLLWLYFTGIVLVLGAEINSALEQRKSL